MVLSFTSVRSKMIGNQFYKNVKRFRRQMPMASPLSFAYFSTVSTDPRFNYLSSLDIESKLHNEIVKTLEKARGSSVALHDLQAFGSDGLMELANAVAIQQRKRGSGKTRRFRMIQIQIPHHQKTTFELKWKYGDSLLDLAKSNEDVLGEYMEGTCGGQMSCCTCHVYLDDETYKKSAAPEESELDMLDLAFEQRDTSRLGCQVVLNEIFDEKVGKDHTVTVTIPAGVNNVWN
jgi:ferredoxin